MSNYKFRNPGLWKGVSADDAAAELNRIREKRGSLKPEFVVEESKDKNAVLHNCFTWDNKKAAELWRKQQASDLIRNIVCIVVNENVETEIRAFVNVITGTLPDRSYTPVTEAILDDTAYKDLLAQAKAEMESFINKYSQIEELNGVKAAMLKALDKNA